MIRLFLVFFKVGIFGYGGGLAMLPLIFQSVQDFGFMTAHEFSDLVALSQVTSGAIAVNAATFVGIHYAGIPGALLATLGVILTGGSDIFGCFSDALPDRWGRTLLNRREQILAQEEKRPLRRLTSFDYLLGIDDYSRMGGFRFKESADTEFTQ